MRFDFDKSLRRCPWAEIPEWTWDVLAAWRRWRDFDCLPCPGGIGDQPVWIYEALLATDEAVTEWRQEVEQKGAGSVLDRTPEASVRRGR